MASGGGGGGDSATWTPRNAPLARGAGKGQVLFVDAYTAGVAGDMFVAGLLDLGVAWPLVPYSAAVSLNTTKGIHLPVRVKPPRCLRVVVS